MPVRRDNYTGDQPGWHRNDRRDRDDDADRHRCAHHHRVPVAYYAEGYAGAYCNDPKAHGDTNPYGSSHGDAQADQSNARPNGIPLPGHNTGSNRGADADPRANSYSQAGHGNPDAYSKSYRYPQAYAHTNAHTHTDSRGIQPGHTVSG